MRGQKVAVVTIDPAAAAGLARSAWSELSGEPRRIDAGAAAPSRALSCKGELWAMMLDAKAHVRRDRRAPGARRARARGDPRQPRLPRALHGGRRLAGAERGRQALRALRGARLRRDRARHAAVAQRARLPRRARPAARLPRRARAAGVPRPGRPDARACSGAARRSSSRSSRASPASTCSASCRASSARWRACSTASASARAASRSCCAIPTTTFLIVTSPEPEPAREARVPRRAAGRGGDGARRLIVNRVHSDGLDGQLGGGGAGAARAGAGRAPGRARGEQPRRLRRARAARPRERSRGSRGAVGRSATPILVAAPR